MTLVTIIALALKVSILLLEFSLGLRASPEEPLYLIRRPALLLRSMLAMYVIVPLFAVGIAAAFELATPVRIALVALALSPIPPLLPKKQAKAGGKHSYIVALLVIAAMLAIVFIPLSLNWLAHTFAKDLRMSVYVLARFVLLMILAPLVVGMLVRGLAPSFSAKIVDPLTKIAILILVLSVLPVLFVAAPLILSLVGDGTILALLAFNLVGLAVGHLLGGPVPENRTVLSLAVASRHPGMAMTIAAANFPEEKKLVLAAVLLYLIVGFVVTLPYLFKKRRVKDF